MSHRDFGSYVRDLVRSGQIESWQAHYTFAYSSRDLDTLREIVENSPLEWLLCLYPRTGREDWHWRFAEMFWERAFPGHWREKIVEIHGKTYHHPHTQPIPILPC